MKLMGKYDIEKFDALQIYLKTGKSKQQKGKFVIPRDLASV